jgi:hypothetical protein
MFVGHYGVSFIAKRADPVFFGPPPASPTAAASTALVAYFLFALVIWWIADRPTAREMYS